VINITEDRKCERCEVDKASVLIHMTGKHWGPIRNHVCEDCADDINTHLMEIRAGDIAGCKK